MDNDSYVFDDMGMFSDDSEICSLPENESTMGHLEIQDGEPLNMAPTTNKSGISVARKLWFTSKSLTRSKKKGKTKQEKIRHLEIQTRDLSRSRENWKKKAILAEKKNKELENQIAEEKPLKQTIRLMHE